MNTLDPYLFQMHRALDARTDRVFWKMVSRQPTIGLSFFPTEILDIILIDNTMEILADLEDVIQYDLNNMI